METRICGDLIALEKQVRSQVENLRDELLGRYAASVSELLVELGEEQQPGFPKSYNCAITVTTGPGDRISSRCRERGDRQRPAQGLRGGCPRGEALTPAPAGAGARNGRLTAPPARPGRHPSNPRQAGREPSHSRESLSCGKDLGVTKCCGVIRYRRPVALGARDVATRSCATPRRSCFRSRHRLRTRSVGRAGRRRLPAPLRPPPPGLP